MSNNALACVVLAAGRGTRMKSDKPKVLHELAGLPMIKWHLRTLKQLSPEKIIVVTAPDAKDVQEAVKPCTVVIQETINGTGGALKAALQALEGFRGDVLVTLADTPLVTFQTLTDLISARNTCGMSVLGMVLEDPSGYGRLVINDDYAVQKIIEERDASDEEKQIQIVNTGCMCIDGAGLKDWLSQIKNQNAQGEYYLTDLPEIIAANGRISSFVMTLDASEVQGCNTQADLAMLETTLQNRLRYQAMLAGVSLLDPTTVYFSHDTIIEPGVVIEPNVYFGQGVQISKNVRIKAFSHIEGAVIEPNVTIGPFARIRPGTHVHENAKIGNFVEIKKSIIGAGSKINHLAYVGDTDMDENVNFSAGAITVNYDGFDKFKTKIGKNVMVGSNVNLVAPVSVADGAFIAAGSTITQDIPADALAIAREKQEIRPGWASAFRKKKKKSL